MTCPRCGRDLDPRAGVRVPFNTWAVGVGPGAQTTDWEGFPSVPTITVCLGCRRAGEMAWAAND